LAKIKITMCHGFGCAGCIRGEVCKLTRQNNQPPGSRAKGRQHHCMMRLRA
jgi:hypothetical protein